MTPQLPAYPRTDGVPGLRARCAHCKCWHYHGEGYGHRVAHCHSKASPYRGTGYILARPPAGAAVR